MRRGGRRNGGGRKRRRCEGDRRGMEFRVKKRRRKKKKQKTLWRRIALLYKHAVCFISIFYSPPPTNGPSHFGENTEHANFGDNIHYIIYMAYRSVQGIYLHNLYMYMIKRRKINTYPRIHFNTCLRWLSSQDTTLSTWISASGSYMFLQQSHSWPPGMEYTQVSGGITYDRAATLCGKQLSLQCVPHTTVILAYRAI